MDFFSCVGQTLAQKIPKSQKDIRDYMTPPAPGSFALLPVKIKSSQKGSQNHKWIALPGSNPSVACTNAIVGRRGTTGRLKLQRTLTNRSGYGPLSTPYLVGGELTARRVFHPSRRTNTAPRSPPKGSTSERTPAALLRQFFHQQLSTCPLSLLKLLLNSAVSSLNLLRNHVNSTLYTYLPAAGVRRRLSAVSDRALQPLHPGWHPTNVSKAIYSRPSSQVRGTRF